MHAGESFADSGTSDLLLTYHMYFVPNTLKLPDGVFVDTTFNANFVNSSRSEQVSLIRDSDGESE